MKKRILLSGFIFLSVLAKAQNISQCDSLIINCCDFDTAGANTLTLYVANPSSVLFDYPGFALLDSNLDTIAKETVNYFGIGTYPQAHTMDIVAPLTLPFAGYLDLYVLFYDTLACRFAFTIADTVTGMPPGLQKSYGIKIFPNPAVAEINIRMDGFSPQHFSMTMRNILGEEIRSTSFESLQSSFDLTGINAGIYFLRITDAENRFCVVKM